MRDYVKSSKINDFPKEKISEMGLFIENILLKEDVSSEEIKILGYIDAFLLFRENFNKEEESFYKESLNEAKEYLDMVDEDLIAVNLWTREVLNKENMFHSFQTETLYERIREKLEKTKNPPITVKNTL